MSDTNSIENIAEFHLSSDSAALPGTKASTQSTVDSFVDGLVDEPVAADSQPIGSPHRPKN